MNQYGKRFRIQAYVDKTTFEKLDAERCSESMSSFVSSILELIYSDENGCDQCVQA